MPIYRVIFANPLLPDELVTAVRLTIECSPTIYHRFTRVAGQSQRVVRQMPRSDVLRIVLEPGETLFDLS